mgnify:CR=1 FL=1
MIYNQHTSLEDVESAFLLTEFLFPISKSGFVIRDYGKFLKTDILPKFFKISFVR